MVPTATRADHPVESGSELLPWWATALLAAGATAGFGAVVWSAAHLRVDPALRTGALLVHLVALRTGALLVHLVALRADVEAIPPGLLRHAGAVAIVSQLGWWAAVIIGFVSTG